jgi:Nif-specific regulatory protein
MVQGDTIRDLAFPCRQNRCLTQTLHFLDKADAVAATAVPTGAALPANPARAEAPRADLPVDEVTRIGPTHKLPPSPASQAGGEPPEGERERLIWAMDQCGWVQAKAARLLRLTPRQLGYALLKNRIEVRKF